MTPRTRSILLALAFALLFVTCTSIRDGDAAGVLVEPGTLPDHWIDGTGENEPKIQVHAYNDDFWILRQSKTVDFEAPFLYLIFGEEKVILLDTGSRGDPPVRETVDGIIARWLEKKGRRGIHLVVSHTHGHGDHIANDDQFYDREDTTLVGSKLRYVVKHYGFENWPNENVTYDLGGRVLDVIPSPGHHDAHIAFYDRRTRLLLTGDTFYPGFLFVFSPRAWPVFRASTKRLRRFCETHPVEMILGCHVEMSAEPGVAYAYRTRKQPNEHPLQLTVDDLRNLDDELDAMGDEAAIKALKSVVIYPAWKARRFGRPPPPPSTSGSTEEK